MVAVLFLQRFEVTSRSPSGRPNRLCGSTHRIINNARAGPTLSVLTTAKAVSNAGPMQFY